ncbi:MAG: putative PEP-binding protein, partial [Prochlorothrix sp.]
TPEPTPQLTPTQSLPDPCNTAASPASPCPNSSNSVPTPNPDPSIAHTDQDLDRPLDRHIEVVSIAPSTAPLLNPEELQHLVQTAWSIKQHLGLHLPTRVTLEWAYPTPAQDSTPPILWLQARVEALKKPKLSPQSGRRSYQGEGAVTGIVQGPVWLGAGNPSGAALPWEEQVQGPMPAGSILVVPQVTAAVAPLLSQCKGLITERGGLTSHGALLARELQIPAVVGALGITQALQTGTWVELNGDRGVVQLMPVPQATGHETGIESVAYPAHGSQESTLPEYASQPYPPPHADLHPGPYSAPYPADSPRQSDPIEPPNHTFPKPQTASLNPSRPFSPNWSLPTRPSAATPPPAANTTGYASSFSPPGPAPTAHRSGTPHSPRSPRLRSGTPHSPRSPRLSTPLTTTPNSAPHEAPTFSIDLHDNEELAMVEANPQPHSPDRSHSSSSPQSNPTTPDSVPTASTAPAGSSGPTNPIGSAGATSPPPSLAAPPITATEVFLTLSQPQTLHRPILQSADGIGLIRSEWFFLHALDQQLPHHWLLQGRRQDLIDRLRNALLPVFQAMGERPVLYRSFDFHGTEFQGNPWLEASKMDASSSPAERSLDHDLFEVELEVLSQIYAHPQHRASLRLLLPYIRTVEEVQERQAQMRKVFATLQSTQPPFPLWIMAEVPSVLLLLEAYVAAGVQGFVVGCNDLGQLLLGLDRNQSNPRLPLPLHHPALQQAIVQIIERAAALDRDCVVAAPSAALNRDLIAQWVKAGVTGITVEWTVIDTVRRWLAQIEQKILLDIARDR